MNLNNGARFQTYVIKGKKNSGAICLNGPAARLGIIGDEVIILSYGMYARLELKKHKVKYVTLDSRNRVRSVRLR